MFFERKKKYQAKLKILCISPSHTIQKYSFYGKNLRQTKVAIHVMSQIGFWAMTICFNMASWSIFRQGGRKIIASINVLKTSYWSTGSQCFSIFILIALFQDLGKCAPCLTWWQNLVTRFSR